MKYLLPLLILIYCHEIKGVFEWTVVKKVTDYGQNVTLFCHVPNCCPKDAGWDRWTPHQRTLFIDVKTGRPNKKYDGKVEKDGYTLIIQNLTEKDLNVSYSCLYGVTLGEQKFLLAEDVFTYVSSAQPNVNDGISEVQVAGIIVGVVVLVAMALAVSFLVFHFYTQKKKGTTQNYTYDGVSQTDKDCFLEDPVDVGCLEGEDAIFTCKVRPGSPPVKWLKGCDEISKNKNCEIYTENSIDKLKLKNTQTRDSGEYRVQVGHISRLIELKVTEKANKDERNRYMRAIEVGSEVREYVRIQVIGKDRVGKTSLVYRLLGYGRYDGISTDGIEINRKCQIRKEDGEWKVGKVDTKRKDMIRRILEATSEKQKRQDLVSETSTPHNKPQPTENIHEPNQSQDHLSTTEIQQPVPSEKAGTTGIDKQPKANVDKHITSVDSNSKSDDDQLITEDTFKSNEECTKTTKRKEAKTPVVNANNADKITEAIIENMKEILSGAKFEKDKMTSEGLVECGIWDFAGQKDYYATHQAFFTPHAIYILVADITDNLKDIQHEKADFDKIGEYIGFWFDSIHCFCTNPSSNKLCPPVIMVCTGIDKVDKVEERKIEYENNFSRIFGSQKKINHRRGIHFISNEYPDEKEIENLKKRIWQIATDMNYFSEERPTRWINLEIALEVVKDMETVYSWKNTVKLAQENSIDEKELVLFLNYHHKIGNIIFFYDKPDYIILQPNWLVKCFRCLVCDHLKMNTSQTGTEMFKLKFKGELSETLLDELFEKDTDLNFGKYKSHILDVMEKFDIIIKPKFSKSVTKSYYMPCMIETSSTVREVREKCSTVHGHCTPWLVLEFEFLPVAYYNHIMFDYIRQYTVCEVDSGHPAIYKGKAVVYLDEAKSKMLIICFSKNAISLQIWEWKLCDTNAKLYENILREICGKIDKLEDKLLHNLHYRIKAKCSIGDYSQSLGRISYEELTNQCKETDEYNCKDPEHKGEWHNKNDIENTWLKYATAILEEIEKKKETPNVKAEDIDSKLSMTALNNEQKGMTNSNMSNDEQDVKDDDPASLNKTVIKDEADSHTLQSSGLQSSVPTHDRAEVMRRNPVLFKSKLFPDSKLSMTALDNEQKDVTNSNMSNDEQDVKEDDPSLLSKTLITDQADSYTIQSSGLQSSVPTEDRAEVMRRDPVPLKGKLFPEWPTKETNSLSYLTKNTKTQLMKNVQIDKFRIYNADPKKKCRVLCIINEKSKDKSVYYAQSYADLEVTKLIRMGQKLGWNLKIHYNKSSSEINTIFDDETEYDFKSVRALFVIIVSSGDQSGIYGTTGEKIQYEEITTKFEKVPSLMEKPKIFILDYCDIESDIPYQKKVQQDQRGGAEVPNQIEGTKMCKVPTEGIQYEVCTTDEHHPNRTNEGRKMLVTNCFYETVPTQHVDTYTCISTTLGRCDKIVKGSWAIGALLSVICEAGHYMTFKEMMKEVQIMVTEALIPEGRPEPKIEIKDCLTKDFYLLPPSS